MDISYLLSVIDLYILNNKNKLIIRVDNNTSSIRVHIGYEVTKLTFVSIDTEVFYNYLKFIIDKISIYFDSIKEEYKNDKYIVESSKLDLSFIKFSKEELININKYISNNSSLFDNNIRVIEDKNIEVLDTKEVIKDVDEVKYDDLLTSKPRFKFQMGFTNYMTLFLSSLFLLDIFMIALMIFKIRIK